MITLLCIIITFTTVLLTEWYRNGKNSELEKSIKAQRDAEFHFSEMLTKYRESQRCFSIAHNNCQELQCEVDSSRSTVRHQQEEVKALRENLKQLRDELGLRHSLKAIKFNAHVPNTIGWTKTEFKLGEGPCGLIVDRLKWSEFGDRYILTQYHTDGSRKEFEYLKTDIVGRIEKYLHA